MLLTQEIEITLSSTIKYYENLGYEIPKVKNKQGRLVVAPNTRIIVKATDLQPNSKIKVDVLCDYCNKNIKHIPYDAYTTSRKIIEKDCCTDCIPLKTKDVNLLRYGVKHVNQLDENKKVLSERMSDSDEDIIKLFEERNYLVHKIDRLNKSHYVQVYYTCQKHINEGIQHISYSNFKKGQGCYYCGRESMAKKQQGENNSRWNGGITSLYHYLRNSLTQWKKDSLKHFNYKCCLTGNKIDYDIHHIYNFNKIVEETLNELNLPLYESVNMYTLEELDLLYVKCLEIHYKYGYGVVISKEAHKLYHSIYGIEDGNIEYFKEFALQYYGKIFDNALCLVDIIPIIHSSDKYYPFKKNCSSKYFGVYRLTNSKMWGYSLKLHGKQYMKQTYKDELECAYDLNNLILSLKGENATINYLTEEEIKYVESIKENIKVS